MSAQSQLPLRFPATEASHLPSAASLLLHEPLRDRRSIRITEPDGDGAGVPVGDRDFAVDPAERTLSMRIAAAEWVCALSEELWEFGREIVDPHPAQIGFQGVEPVFLDSGGIRPLGCATRWSGHAAFTERFLQPLYAASQLGLRLELTSDLRLPRHTWDALIRLQESRTGESGFEMLFPPDRAVWTAQNFGGLRRALSTLSRVGDPRPATPMDAERLTAMEQMMAVYRPSQVLTVQAELEAEAAAKAGAAVVAIERDERIGERLWNLAAASGLKVVPVLADITDPTPSRGWPGLESPSLLTRLRGRFDAVIAGRLPWFEEAPFLLTAFLNLAAEWTNDLLLMELAAPRESLQPALGGLFELAIWTPLEETNLFLMRRVFD